MLRYDADFAQVGVIDVAEHLVPRNGVASYSVTATEDGFVAQWIDDRTFEGRMMVQVFDNDGTSTTPVFELDSSYLNNIETATVIELGNGNLQFNWDDGTSGDRTQTFRPDGTALGPAEATAAYRPHAVEISRTKVANLEPSINTPSDLSLVFAPDAYGAATASQQIAPTFDRFANGAAQTADPNQIGAYLGGVDTEGTNLVYDAASGILMAVWDGHDGSSRGSGFSAQSNADIFYSLFTKSGEEIIADVRLNEQSIGHQASSTVTMVADGEAFVAWTDFLRPNGETVDKLMGTVLALPERIVEGNGKDNALTGNAKRDAILGKNGADTLDGGDGSDILNGAGGSDRLIGGKGNDTGKGGDGDDRLDGGKGGDLLDGGAGKDALNGGSGSDALAGGAGSDVLKGNGGGDTLDGGASDDKLQGGGGADLGSGGAGADTLQGGKGNDTLLGDDGQDKIEGDAGDDSLSGGAGADTLTGGAGNDRLDGGTEKDELNGGAGNDNLIGGDDNDKLDGESGIDTLSGGEGNDTLSGGGDVDILFGANGNDRLIGGKGDDRLTGGADNDKMTGGEGRDTFLFTFFGEADLGTDRITDWEVGVDQIDFRGAGLIIGDTLTLANGNAGLVLSYSAGKLILEGQSLAGFDTDDLLLTF